MGWWLSGLFILRGDTSLAEGGLGYYSMNLLAFVAPMGWSAVLPELAVAGPGQEGEGFQYLGAGILALVALVAVLAAWPRRDAQSAEPRLWSPALLAACIAMALFALSPTVTLGSRVLADFNGPWTGPLAVLRSSGRFAWPLAYVAGHFVGRDLGSTAAGTRLSGGARHGRDRPAGRSARRA